MRQLAFTQEATKARIYLFRLLEGHGHPYEYEVVRNGEWLLMTGELALLLNPQEVNKEHPARSTVTQTPHGYWIDQFGMGLPQWTLRGTMGFQVRPAVGVVGPQPELDGYAAFHAFAELIREYFEENRRRAASMASGGPERPLLRLEFTDAYDDDVWLIEPNGLPTKIRAIAHNPIIRYEFRFTGVRDLNRQPYDAREVDPIALGLLGTQGRQEALARAMAEHQRNVEEALADIEELERTAPGAMTEVNQLMACANTVQFSESPEGLLHREALLGLGTETESSLLRALSDAQAMGPVTPSLEQSVQSSLQTSRLLGVGSTCATRSELGSLRQSWATSLDSFVGAVPATDGDAHLLSVFSGETVGRLRQQGLSVVTKLHGSTPGTGAVPLFDGVSRYVSGMIAPVAPVAGQLADVARGAKGFIDTGLGTVNAAVDNFRKVLNGMQATLIAMRVFQTTARRLLVLRRALNGYLCAIQSMLAFPYLFFRDLRDGLQGLLDLFEMSGCATSYPNLPGLSWSPGIRMPQVVLPR